MTLFCPVLKDRIHRQTDISCSTVIHAELDDPFRPRKNRSKLEDLTENKSKKNIQTMDNQLLDLFFFNSFKDIYFKYK